MSYVPKLIAPQSEYIKALIWFRGGSTQDNTYYFNINKTCSTGMKLLNAYLDRYNQYTKGGKTMKRKFRKFWREWGMTLEEFEWFIIAPLFFLIIIFLFICVLLIV